jgi:phosphoglycolate phosphatase
VRLIIFDVDGTLVDSQDLIVEAQARTFAAHGLAAPGRERSLSVVGLSLREAFTALVGPDGPVESLAEAYKEAFAAIRSDPRWHEPLFPGMADVLTALAARDDIVLGIATGKSRRGVAHLLERHGWEAFFSTIQTADDAPSKPHPGMVLNAMADTGAGPDRTIMVGDSTYDMTMARAAGATALGVSWGYHGVDMLREAGAGAIVDDHLGLLAALDGLALRPGAITSPP